MLYLNIKKIVLCFIIFFAISTTYSFGEVKNDFIHFLSVREGDCILIEDDGKYTLIDSGEPKYYEYIINYLKENEINELENIIFTHAHIDHIGCLDRIINNEFINVKKVYGSDYINQFQNMSKEEDFNLEYIESYSRLLEAVKNKQCELIIPYEDMEILLGDSATLTFYNTNINNPTNGKMNDTSICLEYKNLNDKVLLASDIVFPSEKRIMHKLSKVDVIKIPHHGYPTSSSWELIEKTKPKFAILTSERINNSEVLAKYKYKDIDIYSTFDNGNIILESTGNGIKFEKLKKVLVNNTTIKYKDNIYYLNENGLINKEKGFFKVKIKELSGYCSLDYLELVQGQDVYSNKMLDYQVSNNVRQLNIRKYPNKEISPIAFIGPKSLVKVIDTVDNWANIIFGYDYGYMLFDDNGVCKLGFQKIDKESKDIYYFSEYNGTMLRDKWIKNNKKAFYLKENGVMACNEVYEINGVKYKFNKKGHLKYINNEKFDFDTQFDCLYGDKHIF